MRYVASGFFLAAMFGVASMCEAQPPQGDKGKFPGGPGGRGGMPQPGQILPGFLQEALKLTDEQKKQIAELQKDVDAKLDKLLTDDQKKQLKELRERGPGGPGGFGRPGGDKGFPGRPGGDKAPAPPAKNPAPKDPK